MATHKPHVLAPHLGVLIQHQEYGMDAVIIAKKKALELLEPIHPSPKDAKDYDAWIRYALHFQKDDKPQIKAAGELLRMCIHSLERGSLTDTDKSIIPQKVESLKSLDNSKLLKEIKKLKQKRDYM